MMTDVEIAAANIAAAGWPLGPRENPCTCGQPWHTHGDGLPDGCTGYVHDPADALAQDAAAATCASLLDDIAAYDDHAYQQRRTDRPPGPRVSDVDSCRRQVWYRETPPEDYTPRRVERRAATMGTAFHDKAAVARGWRYPWRHQNMPITVPGLDGTFYIDEYDPISGTVIEDKTCGEYRWDVVGDEGPADSAIDQAMIYALALDSAGWPVNRIQIIAVRRDNGDEEAFWYFYDPARAQRALDRLLALADAIELGVVPPRDGTGPGHWRCRYCPALQHCWQIDAATAAGRSPESWVALGPDPDAEEITWAAATVWELARAKSGAKAAYDQAVKLLDGVTTGRYGEFNVTNVKRNMPEYKQTHHRNLEYWQLDEDHRPAFDVVAEPEKRVDRYVRVTRERAARRSTTPEPATDEHLDTIA